MLVRTDGRGGPALTQSSVGGSQRAPVAQALSTEPAQAEFGGPAVLPPPPSLFSPVPRPGSPTRTLTLRVLREALEVRSLFPQENGAVLELNVATVSRPCRSC